MCRTREVNERKLMAIEDNLGLRYVPTAPLSSQDDRVHSSWINQVLDEIEASHTTWSEKNELYCRIESLLVSNSQKDTQIYKLSREDKLKEDQIMNLRKRIKSLYDRGYKQ